MKTMDKNIDSIGIVGLGYVGIPLSLLLARNFNVIGFDTDNIKISKLNNLENPINEPGVSELLNDSNVQSRIKFTSDSKLLFNTKVKILTVGTPYDELNNHIDYSQLESALDILKTNLKQGDVLILKSTVPPGTTNGIVKQRIEDFGLTVPDMVGLAFSPERMIEGQAINDFLTLPKIIGSSDSRTTSIVKDILNTLGGDILEVSSPETAELVKMVDNYSRYVFLGLTNELALISEKVGVDVLELLWAAKHKYPRNAGLLFPGPGVGGSCLNKDPFILRADMNKKQLTLEMVEAAKSVNTKIPIHVAELVKVFAGNRKKVVIGGVAFKGDTDDTRFTPTYQIRDILLKYGFTVKLSDPFVKNSRETIEKDIYKASDGTDILLLLTDHKAYKNINLEILKSKMNESPLIIDTRGIINRTDAINALFEYHGLGRI